MFGEKLTKITQDVAVRVALDSFNAKKLTINNNELLHQAAKSGVYFFFVKNQLMMRFNPNDSFAMNFLLETAGRSGIEIIFKMVRSQKVDYMKLLMENGAFAASSIIGGNIIHQLKSGTPLNGLMGSTPYQEESASQPIPPAPQPQFKGFPPLFF